MYVESQLSGGVEAFNKNASATTIFILTLPRTRRRAEEIWRICIRVTPSGIHVTHAITPVKTRLLSSEELVLRLISSIDTRDSGRRARGDGVDFDAYPESVCHILTIAFPTLCNVRNTELHNG